MAKKKRPARATPPAEPAILGDLGNIDTSNPFAALSDLGNVVHRYATLAGGIMGERIEQDQERREIMANRERIDERIRSLVAEIIARCREQASRTRETPVSLGMLLREARASVVQGLRPWLSPGLVRDNLGCWQALNAWARIAARLDDLARASPTKVKRPAGQPSPETARRLRKIREARDDKKTWATAEKRAGMCSAKPGEAARALFNRWRYWRE